MGADGPFVFVHATHFIFHSSQKADVKPLPAVQPAAPKPERAPVVPQLPVPVETVPVHHDVPLKEEELCQAFSEALIEDIDEGDADQPQLCSEYVKDIYAYLRRLEVKVLTWLTTHMTGARGC